jgi:hypothetical protein
MTATIAQISKLESGEYLQRRKPDLNHESGRFAEAHGQLVVG